MNINQLRYFAAVAECKSFTKAAAQFYISQTAITQQIRMLEERVGVPLFDRTSRPIKLTPANAFLSDTKAILERLDSAMNRVRAASVGFVGSLRVGYTKSYERSGLSNTLRKFHTEYPNVLISCYRCDTDTLASGLLNNKFDIIFTWDSTELYKDMEVDCRVVERSPLFAALPASHPFAGRARLHRSELKNEKILYMTPSKTGESAGDRHFFDLYEKAGFLPDILFRSNDAESILMMVAAEEGISLLPAYVISKLTNAENLAFVPLEGEDETAEIIAAWLRGGNNPVLQRFTEFI